MATRQRCGTRAADSDEATRAVTREHLFVDFADAADRALPGELLDPHAARAGGDRRAAPDSMSTRAHGVGDRRPDSYGSMSSAASPTTSGSDDTLEVMTGVPLAIASSGGSPKPS